MVLLQTAAHCVASYSAAALTARVGEWDATSTQDTGGYKMSYSSQMMFQENQKF